MLTTAPFNNKQIEILKIHQDNENYHPYTCLYDGDNKHIMYEFNKLNLDIDYDKYIKDQKLKGVYYPESMFNQTNLIPKKEGLVCPVCDYIQKNVYIF
jgi:hypothetical protein